MSSETAPPPGSSNGAATAGATRLETRPSATKSGVILRLGEYDIEARIGRGGMAEVFLARVVGGPRAGSPVAVKRLLPSLAGDPAYRELFAAEARLATQLRHPAIVEVIASGEESGAPFLVMEYVDGRDLARLLAACRRRGLSLPLDFALHVAHRVAEALAAAHAARDEVGEPLGIVHCDVSPSNVFVSRRGEVKLGDFGVARPMGRGPAAALGKLRYLAPEQLQGGLLTPAVDVFGLGATLYELLTGAHAFPGDDPQEVVAAVAGAARRLPSALRPEVPAAVDALVVSALAAAPAERPPSAAAMATALEGLFDERIGNTLAIAALVRGVLGA